MIYYKKVSKLKELEEILQLQNKNLPFNVSSEIKKTEGFVTVQHDLRILSEMNNICPHIIATNKDDDLIGYALCMHPTFKNEVEVLKPMFKEIDSILSDKIKYLVMGQICIEKKYRKQGVFRGLYQKMKQEYIPRYTSIITEVDFKNDRSLQAHYAIGFQLLKRYTSSNQEWALLSLK